MEWTSSSFEEEACLSTTRKCLFGSPEMSPPSASAKTSPYQLTLPEMSAEQTSPFHLYKVKKRISFIDGAVSSTMKSPGLKWTPFAPLMHTQMSPPSASAKTSPHQLTLPEMPTERKSPFHLFKVKKRISCRDGAGAVSSTMKSTDFKRTPFAPLMHTQGKNQETSPFANNPVMLALQKSAQDPNLIGDFSEMCTLPIIDGKHPDLKTIAPVTVAKIVMERWQNVLIIDCRFPYEYAGGHIMGADNIYLKDDAVPKLFQDKAHSKENKTILIFYCEFSSKRGPEMYHFVRNKDRDLNKDTYPALFFPEMYLMEGGYSAFFAQFKECCIPPLYMKMSDPRYSVELSKYRNQCKRKNVSRRLRQTKIGLKF